jgi:hypothetical protein
MRFASRSKGILQELRQDVFYVRRYVGKYGFFVPVDDQIRGCRPRSADSLLLAEVTHLSRTLLHRDSPLDNRSS